MSNWKRNAKAAISALAFLGVSAAMAHADSFGAISLSPETGATGWSHDYSSRWEAEEVAQSHCERNADDCRTARILFEPFRQLPADPLAMLRRKLTPQSNHPWRITNGCRTP
jgi:hypothetical protein